MILLLSIAYLDLYYQMNCMIIVSIHLALLLFLFNAKGTSTTVLQEINGCVLWLDGTYTQHADTWTNKCGSNHARSVDDTHLHLQNNGITFPNDTAVTVPIRLGLPIHRSLKLPHLNPMCRISQVVALQPNFVYRR